MAIVTYKITVTVAGSAGSAAGSAISSQVVNGTLVAIYVDHTASAATCDITVATQSAPVRNLLVKADSNTDAWFFPMAQAQLSSTGADITGIYVPQGIDDHVSVTIAQSDAGSVTVYLLLER